MARVSIFLIAVVLLVGMVGYGSHYASRESYDPTIASTTGGSVITPGEGTFIYNEGSVVDLVAGIELGDRLTKWTDDVGTVANFNDATTTIAINDRCSITANFEEVNIVIAAGNSHTVGVKSDGTVVAAGWNDFMQCMVDKWILIN